MDPLNNENSCPIITVDGPSGSGKGTICRLLSQELGWSLLDSGALYRLTALAANHHGVDLSDVEALQVLAEHLDVRFVASEQGDDVVILLEGEEVTHAIRAEQVGNDASKVASITEVRSALLKRQRDFAQSPGLVADGRDMGTVVFPHAPLKIYLDASAEVRADRRYKQLIDKGLSASLEIILEDIRARDDRDMKRSVAPLRPADDAVILDSTSLSIDEVMKTVLEQARHKGLR